MCGSASAGQTGRPGQQAGSHRRRPAAQRPTPCRLLSLQPPLHPPFCTSHTPRSPPQHPAPASEGWSCWSRAGLQLQVWDGTPPPAGRAGCARPASSSSSRSSRPALLLLQHPLTRQAGEEGRAGIEAVALHLKRVRRAARMVVRLHHRHAIAVPRQQRRAAEACANGRCAGRVGGSSGGRRRRRQAVAPLRCQSR